MRPSFETLSKILQRSFHSSKSSTYASTRHLVLLAASITSEMSSSRADLIASLCSMRMFVACSHCSCQQLWLHCLGPPNQASASLRREARVAHFESDQLWRLPLCHRMYLPFYSKCNQPTYGTPSAGLIPLLGKPGVLVCRRA